MENLTENSPVLQLEGLLLSRDSTYAAFSSFLLLYIFTVVANSAMALLIASDRSLHQPMYLLYANLALNDLLLNSVVVPRVLVDMLRPPSQRLIHFYECAVQAFFVHFFSTASHTILMTMAFDRYVAICSPLRYAAIMTNKMLIKLTVFAWAVAFVLVGILIGLTLRLNRCRTFLSGTYCANAPLFKLSCENTFINNVYGLTFTAVLLTSSFGAMVMTYSKITVVCLTNKNKSLNRKALQTCSTHLVVYLVLLTGALFIITLHRFPIMVEERKVMALLKDIIPGGFNPVIYGLQSKEVRRFLFTAKSKRVASAIF